MMVARRWSAEEKEEMERRKGGEMMAAGFKKTRSHGMGWDGMGEAPVPSSSSMKAGLRKIRAPIVSLAHKTEKKKTNTWNSRGGQRMFFGTSFSKVDACFPQGLEGTDR